MYTASRFALPLAGVLLIMVTGGSCDSPYFDRNNPARIHRNKGIEAFKKEKWDEAANEWAQSLAANPNQHELYEKQAFAAAKAGRLDEAAATLQKTASFKTDEKEKLDVTRKIAAMYLQNNRPDKAEQYFSEILKQSPRDDASMTWLGEIHSQLGGARSGAAPADLAHLDQAIAYYDQALAINPDAQTPVVNRRIALLKLQDHWQRKKNEADKEEAEVPKRDKKAKAEAHQKALDMQAKLDELKPRIDEATAKLTELLRKKQPGGGDGGTPATDGGAGGTPGGDGGTSSGDGGTSGGDGGA
jgi:tetratricopeptide (TPR) repeat protein